MQTNVLRSKWKTAKYLVVLGGTLAGAAQGYSQQIASSSLPDSPGAVLTESAPFTAESYDPQRMRRQSRSVQMAPKYKRVIDPGYAAQPLDQKEKVIFSVRSLGSATFVSGALVSAGWGHLLDSRPHYGTDKAGFGERLGASALKGATQSIFTYGIYDNVFHQDPRYYAMGRRKPIFKRAVYAAGRTFIGRKDDGSSTPNWANWAGIVSAGSLANAYYPSRDRNVGDTFRGFGTSLGANILSNEISEFMGGLFRMVRHK